MNEFLQGSFTDLNLGNTHDVIAAYNDMLAANPSLAQASAEMLTQRSFSDKLTFGGVPFLRTLRPHFFTLRQYDYMRYACNTLADAMISLRQAILHDEKLRAKLDLTPEEERLALIDPGFEEPSPSVRMDSFWSDQGWHFVECNGESPAAIAYDDVGSRLFQDLPCVQEFQKSYNIRPIFALDRFMEEIMRWYGEFRSNRGSGDFPASPRIAIVDWAGVPTWTEFELFEEYFASKGIKCKICTCESLEYSNGRLRCGDFVIDLLYKRVLTSELLAKPEVAAPVIKAYEDGRVMVMNNFRAKYLHKKGSMALLHDDANYHLYTPEQITIIQRHIPWTRRVAPVHTSYGDGQVDLVDFIRDNRERLVLKPNDEYGGKGVYIGWTISQEEWEGALAEALAAPFVVQERVVLQKEPFPFLTDDGSITVAELAADTDPYVFHNQTQGVLTRLSAQALLIARCLSNRSDECKVQSAKYDADRVAVP